MKVQRLGRAASTAELVARFAARLDVTVDGHGVRSPLGAWMLLAQLAPSADGAGAERIADVLGTDVADAADRVRRLCEAPHPAVAVAAATWSNDVLLSDAGRRFVAGLAEVIDRGPVPSTQDADRWAAQHTSGLVDRFPVAVSPATALVVANAVATEFEWAQPYWTTPSTELGEHRFEVDEVLRRAVSSAPWLVDTAVGEVAVHVEHGPGVRVYSVIAAPEVEPAAVRVAAIGVATGCYEPKDLHTAVLGDGPAWTLSEELSTPTATGTRGSVTLPAWSAESSIELGGVDGFDAGLAALSTLAADPDGAVAAQGCAARYDTAGFAAAAVSAAAVLGRAMAPSDRVPVRCLDVRFAHPFAVVATTVAPSSPTAPGSQLPVGAARDWDAMVLVDAWVTAGIEPSPLF
jgi:hypothetical protein